MIPVCAQDLSGERKGGKRQHEIKNGPPAVDGVPLRLSGTKAVGTAAAESALGEPPPSGGAARWPCGAVLHHQQQP